jgi:hypothetical protein
MKRILLITALTFTSGALFAQQQIGNGDMENWANDDEPDNWNSFLTAAGTFAFAASDQCDESSDARPGSAGTSSCRIFSTSTFGIIANGNVTLGQVQMNSATPTAASNHNKTITGDSDFSQVLTDTPDSIVFWAKFIPNGGSGNARMKATMHTDYDYRDPEDAASSAEVVASAVVNYPTTNGWERFAVAFDYSGPASLNDYLLVTFTTNETAGGGDAGDEVFIDDVQLIYSDVSVSELDPTAVSVSMDNVSNTISVSSLVQLDGDYAIYNTMGQTLQSGVVAPSIAFDANPGVYFVHIATDNKVYKFEILKN